MAKTNPIGVRFDLEQLEQLKTDKIANSPQKALNYYESLHKNAILPTKEPQGEGKKEKVDNVEQKENKHSNEVNLDQEPMPVRKDGENSIDFAARKSEWKVKYNQK